MASANEFSISVSPYGMRVHGERLSRSDILPSPSEIGIAESLFVFETTRDLGLRTRQQYEISPKDFDQYFFPDEPTEVWISVADLLVSVGNTFVMASHGLREAFGLLGEAGIPSEAEDYLGIQSAAFLAEAVEQYFVSIGHQLAAASLRFGAACPSIGADCTTAFFKDAMAAIRDDPRGDNPKAWPYLSVLGSKYGALEIESGSATATCFGAIAGLYVAPAFSSVVDNRNRAFHRFREDFLASDPDLSARIDDRLILGLRSGRELAEACRQFVLGLHDLSPVTVPFADGHQLRMFQDEGTQTFPRPGGPSIESSAFTDLRAIKDCRLEHRVR